MTQDIDEEATAYAIAELICRHMDEFDMLKMKHIEQLQKVRSRE